MTLHSDLAAGRWHTMSLIREGGPARTVATVLDIRD
jgi:hypothetical protein